MDTILPSHASRYRQLIKQSLHLYRISFSKIILLSLLLSTTAFVPRLISNVVGQDIFLNLSPLNPHRLWFVAVDLICLIFFIGIVWRMYCFIQNRHEPLVEDLAKGVKKVVSVFIATLIQSAIVFAVTVIVFGLQVLMQKHNLLFNASLSGILITGCLFIGQLALILYFSTLFIFLVPLITIENRGILGSLERSALLVWNHWWRVFSLQITPWLTFFVLLTLLRYVFHIDIRIYFTEQTHIPFRATLLQLILFALYIPWVAALLLVQLKDLELRKHIVTALNENT